MVWFISLQEDPEEDAGGDEKKSQDGRRGFRDGYEEYLHPVCGDVADTGPGIDQKTEYYQ